MAEGYGGLRAVGVGRPGELAIPEPTEERHVRAGSGSRGRGEQLRGGKSPRRRRGLIPGRRGRVHAAASLTPNKPWLSSSGPAVKNSELVGPETPPVPNSRAQSPSIVIGTPPAPRSTPARSKPPFASGAYALILPSPKLPTSRSPLKRPKSAGAHASPHGAFNACRLATRPRNRPSGSNMSTNPSPGPATSSVDVGSCFAYVTKMSPLIAWMPNGPYPDGRFGSTKSFLWTRLKAESKTSTRPLTKSVAYS